AATSLSDVAGGTSTVTFTFSEATTDFTNADVSVVGGTLSTITGSGTVYTATFTDRKSVAKGETVTVNAASYHDGDGNTGAAGSRAVSRAAVQPSVPVVIAATSLSDVAGGTSTVTFTFSEATTDFTNADVSVVGGTLSTITGSGTVYTATF